MVTFVRSSMSQSLRALAQHVFLDLAGGGRRHRAEHHLLRNLEAREILPAPVDVFGLRGLRAGLELDEGARRLAPSLVRPRDDRGELSRRMLVERDLDFDRGDVLAA